MKLTVASVLALASLVLADFQITNPVQGVVWEANKVQTISWIPIGNDPLAAPATVELLSGNNNNLDRVVVIGTVPGAAGKITFTPPATLPKSDTYAIRVTINGVPHYSHSFQAGSAAPVPKGSESSSAPPSSAPASSSSAAVTPSSSAKPTPTPTSSKPRPSSSSKVSSVQESSSSKRKPQTSSESIESESESEESKSSGASRSSIAAGLLGVVALAALF
ncbi:hypothetical protein IWQ57_002007 [Coemansia nantahalensis]|uniref:Uncharacterized protein n=1 Tax=Coemansia nantahalensis TaxID=2789366 RepID=A0ACC1K2B4_9FUNG|nr:hypothetical protein IWQ57_002007 [Coemansia nantahalensis]